MRGPADWPSHKGGNPSIPSPLERKQQLINYLFSRKRGHWGIDWRRAAGLTCVPIKPPSRLPSFLPSLPLLLMLWAPLCVRVCFRVFGPEGARRDTYGRVEGEGALALEYPVPRTGHPDGGHVGDQQLSEVCSHLRIPASGTTVLPSHRSKRLSVEKDAIFKALRRYIPAAGGT